MTNFSEAAAQVERMIQDGWRAEANCALERLLYSAESADEHAEVCRLEALANS